MLIGYLFGVYFCIMVIMELLYDDILNVEDLLIFELVVSQIYFEEFYYKREELNGYNLDGSFGFLGFFCVLNDNGEKKDSLEVSNISSTYEMLKKFEVDVMEEFVVVGYVKLMMDSDIEKVEVGQGESVK